jgi:hypothetical protein
VVNGETARAHWSRWTPDHFAEFDVDSADPDEAFMVCEEECARSRATVDAAESLDATGSQTGELA